MATVLAFPAPHPLPLAAEPELTTPELARLAVGLYVQAIQDMRFRHTKREHAAQFREFLRTQIEELDQLDRLMASTSIS